MSANIDLKALRNAANRSILEWQDGGARSVSDEVSIPAVGVVAILDRLEVAEARAALAAAPAATQEMQDAQPVGRFNGEFGSVGDALWFKVDAIDALPTAGALVYAAPQPAAQQDASELIALLREIRPNYGAVGSRDADVTAQQRRIDRAIELLSTHPHPSGDSGQLAGGQQAERAGYEWWDRICKLPTYSFLSPAGGGVARVLDSCGNWIEKHAAQVIVDDAQAEINILRERLERLAPKAATIPTEGA
jgi:hypothetical protein